MTPQLSKNLVPLEFRYKRMYNLTFLLFFTLSICHSLGLKSYVQISSLFDNISREFIVVFRTKVFGYSTSVALFQCGDHNHISGRLSFSARVTNTHIYRGPVLTRLSVLVWVTGTTLSKWPVINFLRIINVSDHILFPGTAELFR